MKYRKKPVVIEAAQWDGTREGVEAIRKWSPNIMTQKLVINTLGEVTHWTIGTLEGVHVVSKFDFIIRGIAGEHYPCKPDIFRATYEPVSD